MSAHWDRTAALNRLEGDESLLYELIAILFEDYPKLSDRLRQALARGDLTAVRETAHSLKGSLAYIGFTDAADLALEIEKASRTKDAAKAAGLADALMTEVEAVQQTMASNGERNHGSIAE